MRIDSLGKIFLLYYVTAFMMLWYSEAPMFWMVSFGICALVYAALLLVSVLHKKATSGDSSKEECRHDND